MSEYKKFGEDEYKGQQIPLKIAESEELVKGIFGRSSDLVVQVIQTVKDSAMIVYVDGLVNKDLIHRDIITPVKSHEFSGNIGLALRTEYKETEKIDVFVNQVLTGFVAIFYEGSRKVYTADLKSWNQRSVETPAVEAVIRGPQEGFTENIRTNSALIRRKIKTPRLIFEDMIFGRQSKTAVLLVYIDGIVNREILKAIREKIASMDAGIVLETGHIEQHLDPNNYSPFSGIGLTQKPDKIAQKIAEGRVAILCDGTPECLYIPELFIENIQTVEDYYNRPMYASIIRVLRLIGVAITVFVPGFATAILTFNQEMLPSVFLTSIINSTQRTPMPIAFEIFLLTLMFELLKEAGTRLPKEVGSAITIVGSLIIGDAAVNAGIVSAPSVIIVALTAVSSFIVPNLFEFTILYRALFLLLGSTMGIIGLGTGLFIMLTQIISQRSFGIPVLSSFSKEELKDSFVRFPFAFLTYRPKSIAKENVRRR